MAVGYLLGRQGAKVTVFEKRAELGGIVRYVIPGFRIGDYGWIATSICSKPWARR
jgi:putative selenate reductase